jgi:hypothetical protein
MKTPTSLKWVDDWYWAVWAELEPGLAPLERHQRVQDSLLNALYYEIDQRYGIALSPVSPPTIATPTIDAITAHTLGEIYEQILSHSPTEKKTAGSFYTPVQLVDFAIENTVKGWAGFPTILDPACGGGFFLLSAYQQVLDQQGQLLTDTDREQILLNCIYGVDINPQAVTVTQLSLLLKLRENRPQQTLPDLSQNICCGNAVIGSDFDWEETFPQIFRSGGFNIIIGNPPYVDSEWMTKYLPSWRQYCTRHYKSATGNWDLFCIFIEKSLSLCRSNGMISLVVPNKLASANYAAGARSLLTTQSQILTIQDHSQSEAFNAAVYPLVFVARKRATPLESPEPGATWAIAATQPQSQLLTRLRTLPKLETIAQVNGAATVAEAYLMQALIEEGQPGDPLRMVNSGTIDRYCFLWGQKPMRYLGQSYWQPVIVEGDPGGICKAAQLPPRRLQQARQPKIIVSGMTQRLECAIDPDGSFLAGKSTVIIYASQIYDLRYLLGILNSRLMNFYLTSYFGGNCLKGKYLRIGAPQLRQVPIAPADNPSTLIHWVDRRLTATEEADWLDRQIDQLVYQLYGLTDAEIQIIEEAIL